MKPVTLIVLIVVFIAGLAWVSGVALENTGEADLGNNETTDSIEQYYYPVEVLIQVSVWGIPSVLFVVMLYKYIS